MTRKCFYSFYYDDDNWRVSTVKQIGAIEGQPVVSSNQWEEVKRGGDTAIKRWIDAQMSGRSCVIVLVGTNTAQRPWVKYEIKKGWDEGKGVLGIRINKLLDVNRRQSAAGANPFTGFTVSTNPLTSYAKLYDPPFADSKQAYAYIADNIDSWVEEAIRLRKSV